MNEPSVLGVLEEIIESVVEPAAADVDRNGSFPRSAVTALGERGLRATWMIGMPRCWPSRSVA